MAKKEGKILIVDDDEDVLLTARLFLKQHYVVVQTENDPQQLKKLLGSEHFDVILLDMNFSTGQTSGKEGLHWLNTILSLDPTTNVIMITAYGDVEQAVAAVKEGATDFVLKPWQNEKLLATIMSAFSLGQTRKEVEQLRSRQKALSDTIDQQFMDMIGVSPSMQQVFRTIDKVASTDANVLILGENGTGKELVARALHRESDRKDEVFISVDLGAVPETLFESELFGHKKGAFTDAREDRAGRFELADGGTLFLDEIGNLSLPMQAKLLSVLQSRQVTRIGSNKPINIDIRLICATNMPLYDMVNRNEFRQDLLYRINTVELQLPPLRDRTEDIPLLAEHFLRNYARKYKKESMRLNENTMNKLQRYQWPGNIRELQHAMERAVILSDSNVLKPNDFQSHTLEKEQGIDQIDTYNLEELEKMTIRKAISNSQGNISKAAQELGLTRAALYRRMEKYGI